MMPYRRELSSIDTRGVRWNSSYMNKTLIVGLVTLSIGIVIGYLANNMWKLQADSTAAAIETESQTIQSTLSEIEDALNSAESDIVITEQSYASE